MSPLGKSRTRRIFRSYHPRWMRPQVPQTVFSPGAQADDSGFRVTKNTHHGRSGAQAGEVVGVLQASALWHPAIVPDFTTALNTFSTSRAWRFSRRFYPLADTKTRSY